MCHSKQKKRDTPAIIMKTSPWALCLLLGGGVLFQKESKHADRRCSSIIPSLPAGDKTRTRAPHRRSRTPGVSPRRENVTRDLPLSIHHSTHKDSAQCRKSTAPMPPSPWPVRRLSRCTLLTLFAAHKENESFRMVYIRRKGEERDADRAPSKTWTITIHPHPPPGKDD